MSKDKLKLRLLFLSPFFYPETISTGKYNTFLVKALLSRGCSIDVITSHPLYPDWRPAESHAACGKAKICRAGLHIVYPRSMVLRRLVLESWFAFHVAWNTFRLRGKIDIVISVSPPSFFVLVANLILPSHVKKIAIIHDLQGVIAVAKKNKLRWVLAKIVQFVEKKSLACCDQIICLSNSMRDVVGTYGIKKEKCRVHYPFPTIDVSHGSSNNLADMFPKDYIHVVYSGALGEKQMPDLLVELFDELAEKRDDVMCHIFSRGPVFDSLLKRKQVAGKGSRVRFHDLVPEYLLDELYERSSIQVIPQVKGVSAGAFPSKLPNLLYAGVPVFVICDESSELASIVRSSDIGTAMHTWNVSSLVDGLIEFIDNSSGRQREKHHRQIKNYVREKFSIERLVDDILLTRQHR